jgi:hypothetical protein
VVSAANPPTRKLAYTLLTIATLLGLAALVVLLIAGDGLPAAIGTAVVLVVAWVFVLGRT